MLLSAAPSTLSALAPRRSKKGAGTAALLVPITGRWAALGASMQLATRLAYSGEDGKPPVGLHDSGDSADTAGKAAAEAVRRGAKVILGPVFGAQLGSVAAATKGSIPIVSFTNSALPPPPQTFLFGITPSQSVSAVLQYARSRGVRRVALVGDGSEWSERGNAAARLLASEIGVELAGTAPPAAAGATLLETLTATGLPDAALFTGGPAHVAASASLLREGGVQVLATLQALDRSPAGMAALEGAWLSAPDPVELDRFRLGLPASARPEAGVISALAFDSARLVRGLAESGQLSREGLIASSFTGVTGAVRFREDGRCVRELAIVAPTGGETTVVGRKAGL